MRAKRLSAVREPKYTVRKGKRRMAGREANDGDQDARGKRNVRGRDCEANKRVCDMYVHILRTKYVWISFLVGLAGCMMPGWPQKTPEDSRNGGDPSPLSLFCFFGFRPSSVPEGASVPDGVAERGRRWAKDEMRRGVERVKGERGVG